MKNPMRSGMENGMENGMKHGVKNKIIASVQPNRWYREQLWRHPFPHDRQRARHVRRALVKLRLYPGYDLARNEKLAGMEANYRAALPEMIAELDRTDLVAVTDMVRVLVLRSRRRGFFRRYRR